jgi:plasminogen activator inhibitor 1 RNA-binding protein
LFFQDGSDFQAKLTLTTLGPMVGKMFFFGEKSPIRTYTRLSAAKQALDYLMAHPLSQGRIDLSLATTKDPNKKKNKGVKKSHYREGHSGKGKGKGGSRGDSGREYPRRSGTGRGREGNRGGGGKYNWGKDTDTTAAPAAEGAEGAEAAAEAAAAPVVEAEPIEEEEPTMSFEEYEKAQADKMAALNSLNKYEEVTVKADDDVVTKAEESIEDEYACMFHDPSKTKKDYGKKGARDGYKQADQVLNLKFVDENEGGGKGKGGKGDRRQGGKGRQGGKVMAPRDNTSGGKANIDLSNDMAFPTLGV